MSVRAGEGWGWFHTFKHANPENDIHETSGPIANKIYLKHFLGGGKAALGFGPDQIQCVYWFRVTFTSTPFLNFR